MNSWSPERRRKFALVVLGTVVVLVVLWQGGIVTLESSLQLRLGAVEAVERQLKAAETAHAVKPRQLVELDEDQRRIRALEDQMAHVDDLLGWVIEHSLPLQGPHDVIVSTWGGLPKVGEVDVPPPVPYKAATYSLTGNAHFQDFGGFLADLENSSPFLRVRGLTLQAAAPGFTGVSEPERLAFQIDFSVLVSTNMVSTNAPSP